MKNTDDVIALMRSDKEKDVQLVIRAADAARQAHKGQKRLSGEPYFHHVYETAKKLAEIGMDAPTIAAGFLHDTIEDKLISKKEMREEFGEDILFLVKGVTKLGTLKYRGLERHVESLRKLFIATAQDVRVVIIRLADRLHNIKTLHAHKTPEKRRRIAIETLEILVPLADRLGIGQLKGELEDEAFRFAYPEDYEKVAELLRQKRQLNEKYMGKVHRSVQKELAKQNIKVLKSDYRIKRTYSLYKKLQKYDWDIDKVYDVIALRIIVDTVEDCYRVLGIIHNMWRPIPGRIKDYIATPKQNGYQSLHTTVFTGDGGFAEIQIRTQKMHEEAEYGIAAHFLYKKTSESKSSLRKSQKWLFDQLLEWQKNVSETGEFMQNLRGDFFSDRVFVYTPEGDVIDLPEGATPIDFAFAIHTDIGNTMSGAKINGKMSALGTKLKNNDIVEIISGKNAKASDKWLKDAQTTLARRQIRIALQKQKGSENSFMNFFTKKTKK